MSVVGLDLGTSGCKAVAFAADGTVLASAARSYPLRHPRPGWAELDATEIWRRAAECIREAAAVSPVEALGICCQGEAFVAIDDAGAPLTPAMVSSDTRAAPLVAEAVRERGTDFFYRRTGHTPHPLFSLFKFLWLRRHEPEVWRRARQFLCLEDFVHRQLGIEPALSWSLAGRTMLFNPATHEWDPELLALAGLEPGRLARPLPAGAVAGEVPAALAADLGLAPGCRVVAGGHDQVAAALGAGVIAGGQALYAMGSVECIVVASDRHRLADGLRDANLCSYDHAAPGRHAHLAYNLTGSNLLEWFREQFAIAPPAPGVSAQEWMLGQMPPGPTDLLVLPHFTATGTPHFDAQARGAILGLRFEHDRFAILRALLEGLALEMRLNVDLLADQGIAVREFRATGGGSRSRAALQVKADVLQRPIVPLRQTEGGCIGTALLAQASLAGVPLETLAADWVKTGDPVEPDPACAAAYAETFARYGHLHAALKPFRPPAVPAA